MVSFICDAQSGDRDVCEFVPKNVSKLAPRRDGRRESDSLAP
ncbi:MAG: hypothetical protein Q8N26_10290 [Myxococcales bacterium]|nr:hypothetical protein [Myxococcales bacterium]